MQPDWLRYSKGINSLETSYKGNTALMEKEILSPTVHGLFHFQLISATITSEEGTSSGLIFGWG